MLQRFYVIFCIVRLRAEELLSEMSLPKKLKDSLQVSLDAFLFGVHSKD